MDNFDLKKYLVENKVTTNSRMMNENEEDFSVELLVPTIYRNGETGELAETPAAFGARSELKHMDITNYSDGEELIEWVFDGSLEKAKYFEKEYPGLFKVVGGSKMIKEKISNLKELTKEMGNKFKIGDNLTTYGGDEEVTVVSVQPNLAAALADTKNPKAVEALKQDIRQGFVDKEDENKPFYLVTSEAFPIDKYYVESELESE